MKQVFRSPVALLLAAMLCGSGAPAAEEALDEARQLQVKQRMRDEMALLRDQTDTAKDRAELESFLRRLRGRFRIDGRIEELSGSNPPGQVTGVADCRSVGEGPGVDCIINATWPPIDSHVANINAKETNSELLNTFRPAVLVLGVDPNQNWQRIRTLLVTADGLSLDGLGVLSDNSMWASRLTACMRTDPPKHCLMAIELAVEPESGIVTVLLATSGRSNIQFTMRPDADARAEKKLKSLRSR